MIYKFYVQIFTKRFLKYFTVGLFAFAVDTAVLYFFKYKVFEGDGQKIFNLIYSAKLVSATVGMIVSFLLNRYWSFDDNEGKIYGQAFRMFLVFVFNIVFGAILYSIYYEILLRLFGSNFALALPSIGNLLTTATQMFINFFIYKIFVFKIKEVKLINE